MGTVAELPESEVEIIINNSLFYNFKNNNCPRQDHSRIKMLFKPSHVNSLDWSPCLRRRISDGCKKWK
jgi:hypothetical protein